MTNEVEALRKERDELLRERDKLKDSNKTLVHLNHTITAERDELRSSNESLARDHAMLSTALVDSMEQYEELQENWNPLTSSLEDYGGFKKVTDKSSRVLAVGAAILALLSVLMKRTQPITRLRTVCDALFSNSIFGIEGTKIVLRELYMKYFF